MIRKPSVIRKAILSILHVYLYQWRVGCFSNQIYVSCYKTNRLSDQKIFFSHKRVYFSVDLFFCFIEPLPLNYHIKYNIHQYQKWLGNIHKRESKAEKSGFCVSTYCYENEIFIMCVIVFEMKWIKMKEGSLEK